MASNINVSPVYVLAGEATLTVDNGVGQHFTYHVYRTTPTTQFPNTAWFIKVLTGPNNTDDYTYLGMVVPHPTRPMEIDPKIKLTGRSKFGDGGLPLVVARWALRVIWQSAQGKYVLPEPFSIRHLDRCGKCGRPLTTPESLDCGLGPDCAAELGVQWGNRDTQGGGSADASPQPRFASFDFATKDSMGDK